METKMMIIITTTITAVAAASIGMMPIHRHRRLGAGSVAEHGGDGRPASQGDAPADDEQHAGARDDDQDERRRCERKQRAGRDHGRMLDPVPDADPPARQRGAVERQAVSAFALDGGLTAGCARRGSRSPPRRYDGL